MHLPFGRVCLVTLLAGGPAFAQQTPPPAQTPQTQPAPQTQPTFRTAVDVVAVDVSVIDRDG